MSLLLPMGSGLCCDVTDDDDDDGADPNDDEDGGASLSLTDLWNSSYFTIA